jgi:type II secretion system protein C
LNAEGSKVGIMQFISEKSIAAYIQRHMPSIIALVIAVLGTIAVTLNTRGLLHVTATPSQPSSQSNYTANQNTPVSAPFDVASISALNLFGTVVIERAADPMNLPTTQIALKLTGIFASTQTEHSRVLIAENGKTAKSYFAGDELPDQIMLRSVESDFVIIQRNGQLEKLPLHPTSIAQAVNQRRSPAMAITETLTAEDKAATTSSASPTPVGPQDLYRAMDARIAAIRQKNNNPN